VPLGQWSISVTLTLTNQFTVHTIIVIKYGTFFLRNSYNSGKIFTLQKNNIIFEHIYLYTILIQGINTIFIDQIPVCLVLITVHSILASEYSTVYHVV